MAVRIHNPFRPDRSVCGLVSTVVLGTFDGVHRGHRELLATLVKRAETCHEEAVVVTFDRHPKETIEPEVPIHLLSTLDEKLERLAHTGIDRICVLEFTPEFANLPAEDFVAKYLVSCLGMKHFVVGYDHTFGYKGGGSPENLSTLAEKFGFTVDMQEPLKSDGILIKSSNIRSLTAEGNVGVANTLLGYAYSFRGRVVAGEGIGSKLGFPTANVIPVDRNKLIPGDGVYGGWMVVGERRHNSVISISRRPTFNGGERVCEVHIPDMQTNLYGKKVTVGFLEKIRNITTFTDSSELVRAIQHDIEHVKRMQPTK